MSPEFQDYEPTPIFPTLHLGIDEQDRMREYINTMKRTAEQIGFGIREMHFADEIVRSGMTRTRIRILDQIHRYSSFFGEFEPDSRIGVELSPRSNPLDPSSISFVSMHIKSVLKRPELLHILTEAVSPTIDRRLSLNDFLRHLTHPHRPKGIIHFHAQG